MLKHPRIKGNIPVLCSDPLILYIYTWDLKMQNAVHRVLSRFRLRPVWLFLKISWCGESEQAANGTLQLIREQLRRHPNRRFVVCANTAKEYAFLRKAGILSVFANHNAMRNEAVFHPLPDVEKKYDAIYDARLVPYKRHELAAKVKNLALNIYHAEMDWSLSYVEKIRELLAAAHWFKDPSRPDLPWLPLEEINRFLNQCRVGLILSSEEGPNYASIQYLLAGLPVVSTESRGGRDVFFDKEFVRIVPDDPEAVADAVQELIARNIPAGRIRAKTLEKIDPHRHRMMKAVEDIARQGGGTAEIHKPWTSGVGKIWNLPQIPHQWGLIQTVKQAITSQPGAVSGCSFMNQDPPADSEAPCSRHPAF